MTSIQAEEFTVQAKHNLLQGKTVVITGGAGLLGRQFSRAIVESGGRVVVADQDLASATSVVEEITRKFPDQAIAVAMNITEKQSVTAVLDLLQSSYGHLDAVVNNAYPRNQNYGRKFEDVTYEDFCENIGMHLGGYFLVAQQFAALFRKQRRGNIVNISSIYGVITPRFELYSSTEMGMPVEYAAIKSSLIHLTKYMAKYLKGTGIRVNAISPGASSIIKPRHS